MIEIKYILKTEYQKLEEQIAKLKEDISRHVHEKGKLRFKCNELRERIQARRMEIERIREQNAKLEEKLKAITCIECEKDLLGCTCDAIDTQLNL